jgi:hypothetical protein
MEEKKIIETILISERVFERINKNVDDGSNGLRERIISIEYINKDGKNSVLISFEYSPSDAEISNNSNIYLEEDFEKKHISEVIFPISVLISINIVASFIKKMLMKRI